MSSLLTRKFLQTNHRTTKKWLKNHRTEVDFRAVLAAAATEEVAVVTEEVEAAINEKGNQGLHDYYHVSHNQLMELTVIVATKITKLQRKSLGALITIDVHARDVGSTLGQPRATAYSLGLQPTA